jgi:hypothetical protein
VERKFAAAHRGENEGNREVRVVRRARKAESRRGKTMGGDIGNRRVKEKNRGSRGKQKIGGARKGK